MKKILIIIIAIIFATSCGSQKPMTGKQSVEYHNKQRGIPN